MRSSIYAKGINRKPLIQGEIMSQRPSRIQLMGLGLDNYRELSKHGSKERIELRESMQKSVREGLLSITEGMESEAELARVPVVEKA